MIFSVILNDSISIFEKSITESAELSGTVHEAKRHGPARRVFLGSGPLSFFWPKTAFSLGNKLVLYHSYKNERKKAVRNDGPARGVGLDISG